MIGARFAARDDVFRRSGLEVTYLRANLLIANALWWLPAIRDQGRVCDASDPGLAVPVDPEDGNGRFVHHAAVGARFVG